MAMTRDRLATMPPASLPDPRAHARRQRDATSRQIVPQAARLLYVDSVATDGTAVLREADGTVIEEDVAVVGGRLAAGDRVVRLVLPGTGRRGAAPSYLALGPAKAQLTPPAVSLVAGAAGAGATLTSVSGTDGCVRVVFNTGTTPTDGALLHVAFVRRRTGTTYALLVSGRGESGARLVAGGYWQSGASDVSCDVAFDVAPPASTAIALNLVFVDPLFPW